LRPASIDHRADARRHDGADARRGQTASNIESSSDESDGATSAESWPPGLRNTLESRRLVNFEGATRHHVARRPTRPVGRSWMSRKRTRSRHDVARGRCRAPRASLRDFRLLHHCENGRPTDRGSCPRGPFHILRVRNFPKKRLQLAGFEKLDATLEKSSSAASALTTTEGQAAAGIGSASWTCVPLLAGPSHLSLRRLPVRSRSRSAGGLFHGHRGCLGTTPPLAEELSQLVRIASLGLSRRCGLHP
jgi:hypothetical protein